MKIEHSIVVSVIITNEVPENMTSTCCFTLNRLTPFFEHRNLMYFPTTYIAFQSEIFLEDLVIVLKKSIKV